MSEGKAKEMGGHVEDDGGLPIVAAARNAVRVSFEFFPPKTEKMAESLWEAVKRLEPLAPSFVSVTYGAGGSTRERTHETVVRIARETAMKPAAHLTCVAATQGEIDAVARAYWQAGIRHVVALRGDPPDGQSDYVPHPGGYAYASDLVAGLKRLADFEISVAAYPEGHPQSPSLAADIDNLKRKIDAGATRAISQYFFGADVFRRFRDRVAAAGIVIPVVPGILPVTNFGQVVKFSAACGATVPGWMHRAFDGLDDDPDTRRLVAATLAYEQVQALEADGIRDFHFYTLNRADLTFAICHLLGVRPAK
ncbi:methylenetetrahydrofolate reductase [NAD(P)H] [Oleispirillum naphthae]|uniref:methylenetetrahydrofolate reductase [NAD(P)H] n=1 Tax=Oleispirillum naphthae TaxID=2838853 RepID=UPI0030826B4D